MSDAAKASGYDTEAQDYLPVADICQSTNRGCCTLLGVQGTLNPKP